MTAPTLDDRALNRATLARQGLLEPAAGGASALIEHLLGPQAQEPMVPYVTLWTRLRDFVPDDLQGLLERREVLRVSLWRNTIHLVTAADFARFHSLSRAGGNYNAPGMVPALKAGLDASRVARVATELLAAEPLTMAALGRALAERFPGVDPFVLAHTARARLPIVHPPPAGFWRRGDAPRNELWELAGEGADREELVRRYLASFGPATVRDAQSFAGVTRLKAAFDALRPELVTFRGARGDELFDLPDAPRPDPRTPAPVRFLGIFDNVLLGYADRARIVGAGYAPSVNEMVAPILIDGIADATWSQRRDGPVVLHGFAGRAPAAVRAEAERLATFLGAYGVVQRGA